MKTFLPFTWLPLLLLLAGCRGWTHPSVPERELSGLALQYTRQGGVAGFCDTLTITRDTRVTWTTCRGKRVQDRLTNTEREALMGLLRTYRPFEGGHRADPNRPDDMTRWVVVQGFGSQQAGPEAVDLALHLAESILTRLQKTR